MNSIIWLLLWLLSYVFVLFYEYYYTHEYWVTIVIRLTTQYICIQIILASLYMMYRIILVFLARPYFEARQRRVNPTTEFLKYDVSK